MLCMASFLFLLEGRLGCQKLLQPFCDYEATSLGQKANMLNKAEQKMEEAKVLNSITSCLINVYTTFFLNFYVR